MSLRRRVARPRPRAGRYGASYGLWPRELVAEVVRGLSRQTWLLLGVLGICVLVAAWDLLLTPPGAPPASEANDVQGLSAATLLSGVVGGLIVWGFTVVSGWVIRSGIERLPGPTGQVYAGFCI